MTRHERVLTLEPNVIAGTLGGGGWAKHEAEAVYGADEDTDGDVGTACGASRDARATRGAGV
jgi:hypothetical protein